MVEPLRHRQTKEAETDRVDLKPPRHTPTLPSGERRYRAAAGVAVLVRGSVPPVWLRSDRQETAPRGAWWGVEDPRLVRNRVFCRVAQGRHAGGITAPRFTGGTWVSPTRLRGAHPARTHHLGSLPANSPKNTKAVPAHMRPTDNGAPICPVRFKLRLSPITTKPASVMMFMPNKMSLVSIAPPGPTEYGSCISRSASCSHLIRERG